MDIIRSCCSLPWADVRFHPQLLTLDQRQEVGRLRTVRFRAATSAIPPLIRDGLGNRSAPAFLPESAPLM